MSVRNLRTLVGLVCLLVIAGAQAAEMLVSSYFGNNVARYDLASGSFRGYVTGGDLKGPLGMTEGPDHLLYVCSETNNKIERFSLANHAYIDTFASGKGLNHPTAITFDQRGNALVANFESSTIAKFTKEGKYVREIIVGSKFGMKGPDVGTVVSANGTLYVPGFDSNTVYRFNQITGSFRGPFLSIKQPRTILFRKGKVYITSDNGNAVIRCDPDGGDAAPFVMPRSGGLRGASGLAFGEDGFVYVSSWRSNQVLQFDEKTGAFVKEFAHAALKGPTFITIIRDR